MNNDLVVEQNWIQKNWKWLVAASLLVIVCIYLFFSFGINSATKDLTRAYNETELFESVVKKANTNTSIKNVLGTLQPIDKAAILEGSVIFNDENNSVKSSVRVIGTKGSGKMDFQALKAENKWLFNAIKVRVKKPTEKKQTIYVTNS